MLIYSGAAVITKIGDYYSDIIHLQDAPHNTAVVFIILGVVIFLIAFLGCCGAIRENYCMLVTFGGVILIILLIELIGAGLVLGFKPKIRKIAENGILDAISKYETDNSTRGINLDDMLDDMQKNLKCCGATNFTDWTSNPGPYKQIPESCCINADKPEVNCPEHFITGCVDKFEEIVKASLGLLGGIALSIAVIQLFGIVFAFCLGRRIRKEYEVV